MITRIFTGFALSCLLVGQAFAFDGKAYEGTWTGQLNSGKQLSLTLPAGVASGASVQYSFDGQDQGPQTPTVQGNKIRLDNPSGSYIVIGPVKGKHLPYFWTNGTRQSTSVLTKQ